MNKNYFLLLILVNVSCFGGDCSSFIAQPIKEIPAGGITKWTDENGIIHYQDFQGDAVPEGKLLVTRFPHTKDYFALDIKVGSGPLPPDFKKQARQRAFEVYELYQALVGNDLLSRAEINLLFHAKEPDYLAYRNQFIQPGADVIPGFYVVDQNQAVIFHAGDIEETLGITAHEVAHIVNNQLFGHSPRWLNEGLAIYIEQQLAKSGRKALTNGRLQQMRAHTGEYILTNTRLDELLKGPDANWTAANRPNYYQLSGMLVRFLLLPDNRAFTQNMLATLVRQKCRPINLAGYIEAHFPQGISGLSSKFSGWLN